jgi:hypothetical protein
MVSTMPLSVYLDTGALFTVSPEKVTLVSVADVAAPEGAGVFAVTGAAGEGVVAGVAAVLLPQAAAPTKSSARRPRSDIPI